MTTQQSNSVTLIGCMADNDDEPEFIFSHVINGERFFSFTLEVERISNTKDYIPIIISERLIDKNYTYANIPICIEGQFRSFNQKDETKVKQVLYVFAQRIYPTDEVDMNDIYIDGFLCRKPTYRKTPLGREITDIMIAVPRLYGKSDYIPCICWGRNAIYASNLAVGSRVRLSGRIQSREYCKTVDGIEEIRTAYEVSISQINGE